MYRKLSYEQDNLLVMNGRHGLLTTLTATFGIIQDLYCIPDYTFYFWQMKNGF